MDESGMGPADPPPPTFAELYDVARAHLPERLQYLKVPPEDVEDVVHEVVLIAYGKLDTYKPAEPSNPRGSLRAWLYGIAWRYASRQRGKARRRREVHAGDVARFATSEAEQAPSSEQLAAEAQRRTLLDRVLVKLRPERAEVLLMHTVFEMPVPCIAGELNVNENTVKSRLQRARQDAAAAVRRLTSEERNALQSGALLVPWIVETSWLDGRGWGPRRRAGSGSAWRRPLCWAARSRQAWRCARGLGPHPRPIPRRR
jgi:RNA polymerase sigma-70 factor (ECF subfamily)